MGPQLVLPAENDSAILIATLPPQSTGDQALFARVNSQGMVNYRYTLELANACSISGIEAVALTDISDPCIKVSVIGADLSPQFHLYYALTTMSAKLLRVEGPQSQLRNAVLHGEQSQIVANPVVLMKQLTASSSSLPLLILLLRERQAPTTR